MSTVISTFDPSKITFSPIVTAPVTINLTSGSAQPLYTVPAGLSFQCTAVIVRGGAAITGNPQMAVGSAGGGNNNILNATAIAPSIASGSTSCMAPIAPSAVNQYIAASTVINALVTVTAAAGNISVQLVGIQF